MVGEIRSEGGSAGELGGEREAHRRPEALLGLEVGRAEQTVEPDEGRGVVAVEAAVVAIVEAGAAEDQRDLAREGADGGRDRAQRRRRREGHGQRLLLAREDERAAARANPTTLIDLYLLGEAPDPGALAAWRELLWKRGVRDSLNLARRHEDVVRGKPYANPETARGSEVRR